MHRIFHSNQDPSVRAAGFLITISGFSPESHPSSVLLVGIFPGTSQGTQPLRWKGAYGVEAAWGPYLVSQPGSVVTEDLGRVAPGAPFPPV